MNNLGSLKLLFATNALLGGRYPSPADYQHRSTCPDVDAKIAKAAEREGQLRGLKSEIRQLRKGINRGHAEPNALERIEKLENQIKYFPKESK